ncbi:MAG: trypsin-like peptidase domain-containing protein, partial [Planctomycetota bacterium]
MALHPPQSVLATRLFLLAALLISASSLLLTKSSVADSPDSDAVPKMLETRVAEVVRSNSPAVIGLGGGTGVIISPDGLALSVAHVCEKAGTMIRVTMADGRRKRAMILGTHHGMDAAVLQIQGGGTFPHVPVRLRDDLKQWTDAFLANPASGISGDLSGAFDVPENGEWMIAIGYPVSFRYGQAPAVRVGRKYYSDRDELGSDCVIMGGDSGGPLFDLQGRLVGISSRCDSDIRSNSHVSLQGFMRDWGVLTSGLDHDYDGRRETLPKRPGFEKGYGRVAVAQSIAFPGMPNLEEIAKKRAAQEDRVVSLRPDFSAADASLDAAERYTSGRRTRFRKRRSQMSQYERGRSPELLVATRQNRAGKYRRVLVKTSTGKSAGTLLRPITDDERSRLQATLHEWQQDDSADGEEPASTGDDHRTWIAVAKSSSLGFGKKLLEDKTIACLGLRGEKIPVRLIHVDETKDLAVLITRVESDMVNRIESVELPSQDQNADPGQIVVSLNENGFTMPGFITASVRSFGMRQPMVMTGRPLLGVSIMPARTKLDDNQKDSDGTVAEDAEFVRRVRITDVTDDSAADQAGLEKGDVVLRLNKEIVDSVDALISKIATYQIGDTISLRVARGERVFDQDVQLGEYKKRKNSNETPSWDKWGGGPFSERRFEIPGVLTHDTAIHPSACGGPLFDRDGVLVGINIARAVPVAGCRAWGGAPYASGFASAFT